MKCIVLLHFLVVFFTEHAHDGQDFFELAVKVVELHDGHVSDDHVFLAGLQLLTESGHTGSAISYREVVPLLLVLLLLSVPEQIGDVHESDYDLDVLLLGPFVQQVVIHLLLLGLEIETIGFLLRSRLRASDLVQPVLLFRCIINLDIHIKPHHP